MKKYIANANEKINIAKKFIKEEIIDEIKSSKRLSQGVVCGLLIFAGIIVVLITKELTIDSKSELISKFEIALKDNDVDKLAKTIKVESDKINAEELIPVMNYLEIKEYNFNEIVIDLMNDEESLFFELESEYTFLGEDFYININKVNLHIKGDSNEGNITLEESNITEKGEIKTRVMPGLYNISYKLDTAYGESISTKEVAVIEEELVEMKSDVRTITLKSNIDSAEVIINDERTGKVVSEIKDYGPIPNDVELSITLEKDSPWGKLQSEEIRTNKESLININIDIINEEFIEDINYSINEFYNSVFEALNQEDFTIIKNVDDDIKFKIYNSVFENSIVFKDNYIIDSFVVDIEKSECEYNKGNYKANILTKVSYEVSKKILPFIKEEKEEVFLINLIYNDSEWLVEGFQGF